MKKLKYIFLSVFLIVLYQGLLPVLYFQIFRNQALSSNFWISNFTYTGYYILVLLILIIIFRKDLKIEWQEFWKNKKKYCKIGLNYWAKGFLVMIISNLFIVMISGNIAGNESQNREVLELMPIYAISTMCLIGPLIEELVFRKSFRKAFNNKYTFAFITAFIFASLHVLNGLESFTISYLIANWQQLLFIIPYGSLGFFFALAYYESNNIFTSSTAHIIHNTLSILIIILTSFWR